MSIKPPPVEPVTSWFRLENYQAAKGFGNPEWNDMLGLRLYYHYRWELQKKAKCQPTGFAEPIDKEHFLECFFGRRGAISIRLQESNLAAVRNEFAQ